MANNQKNFDKNTLFSWIITVILLISPVWPIGLFLLFRMLSAGSIISPRRRAANNHYRMPPTAQPAEPSAKPTSSRPRPASQPPLNTPSPTWGRGLIIAGAIVTGLFGFVLFTHLIELISYGYYSYLLRQMLYMAGFTGAGLVLLFSGISRRRKSVRYRRYQALIGKQISLSIDALAKAMPVSYRRACDDLQDMLERGFLPSGYVDAASRRIVFSRDGLHEEPAPQPPKEEKPADEGDVLAQIKAINDDIDDESMSRKIDRIGEITGKILDYQRKNPDVTGDLRSFLNYYLPTTLKILRSYAQLEEQGIEGENISSAKARIEGMMDKIVEGFEKRLDKLFQADALDITSDVEVLEQMLQKDGLAGDQLKIEL